MNLPIVPGTVWLVGAGPGDPDLLTRKAEKLICAASIIFYDALVGCGVLDLIPSHVKRVPVGKRSGRHSKDQRSINQMLVDAAKSGERVVRLKGGDPAIFGRASEEMDELAAHDIVFQICPGITAASAAAASANKSLTLRGLARKLIFVTAHAKSGEPLDLDWQSLADPGATLAVYMGKSSAETVSKSLIAAGMAKGTPAVLVENASLENERIFHSRIDLLPLAAKTALGNGPAIMLIGSAMERDQGRLLMGEREVTEV
ncbi:uroporphyrinogen-III C-methyltransferase [Parasphingorhabdus sp.]|uniref:uroporphyrinogen-III C-methyltransferase n=1 Tax=Parasphingorhabdus sp. TaxID=2709688 RepID=UPI003D2E191E